MNQRRRTIRHLNALSRLLILGVLLTLFLLVTSSNALPTSTKSRSKTKTKTKSKTKTRTKTTSTVKPAVTWFKPQPHQFTWNYQLYSDTANPILTNLPNVTLYDLDVFDLPLSQATSLKQKSGKLICYFSAGSYENWRSDANTFPASVLGAKLDGWEGEQWLDVRSLAALRPIMVARMKLAKSKGCDAVDPDNVDAFAQGSTLSEVKQNTGFPITKQDQVNYLKMLATEAHALGMGIGLKNALDLIPNVVGVFDFGWFPSRRRLGCVSTC